MKKTKNKLYFQKQKINWNKNVREHIARSNFKQAKTNNKKEKSSKHYDIINFNSPNLDTPNLDMLGTLLNKEGLPKHLKKALLNLLLISALSENLNKELDKEPEF